MEAVQDEDKALSYGYRLLNTLGAITI